MILDQILYMNFSFLHSFGYLILFVATFLESFPVAGLFVPGSFAIFLGGFLSKFQFISVHVLDYRYVLLFAASGAILGDLFGYILGRYFGREFLHKYGRYFLIKKEYFEKAGQIVVNHTGKALIFGRFHPITRSAAPFIVGTERVKFSRFMFFNILGGCLWALLFTSLGYWFGHSYSFAERFEKWILIFTLAVVVIIYTIYFIYLFLEKRKINKITKVGEYVAKWPG